jgi:hypothetical protein
VRTPHDKSRTSPCKGEVDREAGGRGSRFSRTKDITAPARYLRGKSVTVVRYWNNEVLSNLEGVLGDLLAHTERLSQAVTTPSPALPLAGGGGDGTDTEGQKAMAAMESGT